MELLQLTYFCDVAITENFSRTAKKFMVPPSAVSQSIKRLEKELGFLLFERKSNRISLSKDGAIFFDAVVRAQKIVDDAKKMISESSGELSGEIRLLVLCNMYMVSDAIRNFKKIYRQKKFEGDDSRFDLSPNRHKNTIFIV